MAEEEVRLITIIPFTSLINPNSSHTKARVIKCVQVAYQPELSRTKAWVRRMPELLHVP